MDQGSVCLGCGADLPPGSGWESGVFLCLPCVQTRSTIKSDDDHQIKKSGASDPDLRTPRERCSVFEQPALPRPSASRLPAASSASARVAAGGERPHALSRLFAAFEKKGWSYSRWEGFEAAAVEVERSDLRGGGETSFNLTVSAVGPFLVFEAIGLPLAGEPSATLREAINELNALNFGSIFLLRDCGVVLSFRDPVLRRTGEGFEARLELTLERIERDLALCREVLEEVVRTGVVHVPRMRKAYIQSVAQSLRNPVTLREIQMLANLSGYFTQRSGNVLGLSRSPRAIRGCPVRLTVECGVIQFWALPGRERIARRAGLLGRLAGDLRGGRRLGRSSLEGILKVLNGLNEESGLWRYLLKDGRVFALAAHLPQAGRIQHDEFQMIMESLFRTTREGVNQTAIFSLASNSPATSSRH